MSREGRRPGLQLQHDGQAVDLRAWAQDILDRIAPYAELLDAHTGDAGHGAALAQQHGKIRDPDTTPSARLLAALRDSGQEFHDWTLAQSQGHWDALRARGLPADTLADYDAAAAASIAGQAALEAADRVSFEDYVAQFHAALGPAPDEPADCCGA